MIFVQVMKIKFLDYELIQRKDGMINASDFLRQYNEKNPNNTKTIEQFMELQSTKNFIKDLMKYENLDSMDSVFVKE